MFKTLFQFNLELTLDFSLSLGAVTGGVFFDVLEFFSTGLIFFFFFFSPSPCDFTSLRTKCFHRFSTSFFYICFYSFLNCVFFLFYLSLIFLSLIRHPRVNENTAKVCHINSVK